MLTLGHSRPKSQPLQPCVDVRAACGGMRWCGKARPKFRLARPPLRAKRCVSRQLWAWRHRASKVCTSGWPRGVPASPKAPSAAAGGSVETSDAAHLCADRAQAARRGYACASCCAHRGLLETACV
eukprot:6211530-Pleurochrysis_carterae.AAC.3